MSLTFSFTSFYTKNFWCSSKIFSQSEIELKLSELTEKEIECFFEIWFVIHLYTIHIHTIQCIMYMHDQADLEKRTRKGWSLWNGNTENFQNLPRHTSLYSTYTHYTVHNVHVWLSKSWKRKKEGQNRRIRICKYVGFG